MSTRRTKKPNKNKYIKIQDIQDTIYESDDSSNEILPERDRSRATKTTKNSESSSETVDDCIDLCDFDDTSGEPVSSKETKVSESTTENKVPVLEKSESPPEEPAAAEVEDLKSSGRKRNSLLQNTSITISKKVKTDSNKKMSDRPVSKPLQVELLMEKNRVPFKRRNINTIIEELDTIARKLKEGYEKCERPTYWGTPIVKQSSDKWDPNYIPDKLLEMFEKRHEGDQAGTSSSTSEKTSETQAEYKSPEKKATRSGPEGVDEETIDPTEYENSKERVNEETYNSNTSGRMTLRSRSQNRINYDERNLGDDTSGTEKQSRKYSSKSGKDKKWNSSKKKGTTDFERDQDSQYMDEEGGDPHANFQKLKIDDSAASSSSSGVKSHMEDKAIALPLRAEDEERVICPICGKSFEKNRIETHANHCATETFHD